MNTNKIFIVAWIAPNGTKFFPGNTVIGDKTVAEQTISRFENDNADLGGEWLIEERELITS